MFSFNYTVLLMSIRAGNMMIYTNMLNECMQFTVVSSPISLHIYDFPIDKSFDMCLKLDKSVLNISLAFERINPRELAMIIDKTHIVFEIPKRC